MIFAKFGSSSVAVHHQETSTVYNCPWRRSEGSKPTTDPSSQGHRGDGNVAPISLPECPQRECAVSVRIFRDLRTSSSMVVGGPVVARSASMSRSHPVASLT